MAAASRRNCILFQHRVPLRTGNIDANIANPHNEEGNRLREKIYEVVVPPKGKVIAST
ncbi:IS256 family transposase [Sesbania bispinosa]|nr:IS256 family transposase [Sesbania bispinosa]